MSLITMRVLASEYADEATERREPQPLVRTCTTESRVAHIVGLRPYDVHPQGATSAVGQGRYRRTAVRW